MSGNKIIVDQCNIYRTAATNGAVITAVVVPDNTIDCEHDTFDCQYAAAGCKGGVSGAGGNGPLFPPCSEGYELKAGEVCPF